MTARTITLHIALASALCALAAAPALAETAGPPWPAGVSVPSTRHIQFESAVNVNATRSSSMCRIRRLRVRSGARA